MVRKRHTGTMPSSQKAWIVCRERNTLEGSPTGIPPTLLARFVDGLICLDDGDDVRGANEDLCLLAHRVFVSSQRDTEGGHSLKHHRWYLKNIWTWASWQAKHMEYRSQHGVHTSKARNSHVCIKI